MEVEMWSCRYEQMLPTMGVFIRKGAPIAGNRSLHLFALVPWYHHLGYEGVSTIFGCVLLLQAVSLDTYACQIYVKWHFCIGVVCHGTVDVKLWYRRHSHLWASMYNAYFGQNFFYSIMDNIPICHCLLLRGTIVPYFVHMLMSLSRKSVSKDLLPFCFT